MSLTQMQVSDHEGISRGRVIHNDHHYHHIVNEKRGGHVTNIKRYFQSHTKRGSHSTTKDRNILDADIKKNIINFLKGKKYPQKTIIIAKACNFVTSKELNPTLYCMQRQGTVVKCDLTPPSWKLSPTFKSAPSSSATNHSLNNKNVINSENTAFSQLSPNSKAVMAVATSSSQNYQQHLIPNPARLDNADRFRDSLHDPTAPGAYVPKRVSQEKLNQTHVGRNKPQSTRGRGKGPIRKPHGNKFGMGRGSHRNVPPGTRCNDRNEDCQPKLQSNICANNNDIDATKKTMISSSSSLSSMLGSNDMKSKQDGDKDNKCPFSGSNVDISEPMELDAKSSSSPPPTNLKDEEGVVSSLIENTGSNYSSCKNNIENSGEFSNESNDDEDDDNDEIQTRIRDMIFTRSAMDDSTMTYQNNDVDDDEEYEYDDYEEISEQVKEEEEEVEMWEKGQPVLSTPLTVLIASNMHTTNQEKSTNTVHTMLSLLMQLPMGTTSKQAIVSSLDLTEDEVEAALAICFQQGFASPTEIQSYVKITEIGMSYVKSSQKSPNLYGQDDGDDEYHNIAMYSGGASSGGLSSHSSSLSPSGDDVKFISDILHDDSGDIKLHSRSGCNTSFVSSQRPTNVPTVGRGFSNNNNHSSNIYSSSSPSIGRGLNNNYHNNNSNSNNGQFLASAGPAPTPASLLQNSTLFQMDSRNSITRGVGRGRGLIQSMLKLSDSVRPNNSVMKPKSLSDDEEDDKYSVIKSDFSSSNDYIRQLHPHQDTSSSSVGNSSVAMDNLMPWRSRDVPASLSCSSKPLSTQSSNNTNTSLHTRSAFSVLSSSSTSLSQQIHNQSTSFNKQQLNCEPVAGTPCGSSVIQSAVERKPPLLETPITYSNRPMHSSSLHFSSARPPSPVYNSTNVPTKKPLLPNPGSIDTTVQVSTPIPTTNPSTLQINAESFAALNKNPISAFMEYAQSRKWPASIEVISTRGPSHKPTFLIAAFLGNRRFSGITSHNKKDGRKDAAEQAIRVLISEGAFQTKEQPSVMKMPDCEMTRFDKIAALTHQKFNQLIATIPESFTGRKVIAGMVMKMGPDDVGSVIAIGSGNRCITGDKLSLEGNTVNDCHAEIITRRGFIRFLYYQLASYRRDRLHPIFEQSQSGKLKVKDSVTFHLYISTAPCGDGALFSPRDIESNSGTLPESEGIHHPTFTTPVQGVLRTKMEGGEGTIPINPAETVQTWDGIVRGERLRTMSCSDKICRWNVLGLQGGLLSHLVDTVYLSSLTLGFLFDHGHLSRAVCCRLNRGVETPFTDTLPEGYRLNHPDLGRVTACDPIRETQKTKSYSVNWSACDEKPELLDGTLGQCHAGIEKKMFSRLNKSSLYASFKSTCQHLGRSDLLNCSSYHQAKQSSQDFRIAKQLLMNQFDKSTCGKWVSKPIEEEMFN